MRHVANLETSERLQKVLKLLSDFTWHGTFSIMSQTQLKDIESRCIGHGKYEYRLIKEGGVILQEKRKRNEEDRNTLPGRGSTTDFIGYLF